MDVFVAQPGRDTIPGYCYIDAIFLKKSDGFVSTNKDIFVLKYANRDDICAWYC
jgi:hypothetical protein